MIGGAGFEVAERDHKLIREALGFESEDLMVEQYCKYHNLEIEDIIEFLNGHRYIPNWKLRVANNLEGDFEAFDIDEYEPIPFSLSQTIADFEQTNKMIKEKGGVYGNNANNQ